MNKNITKEELIVITARLKQGQNMIGYSNKQMADALNISEIQYSKILRGHCMITEDKLIILRRELNISTDFLLTGHSIGRKVLVPDQPMTDEEFQANMDEIFDYVENLPIEEKKRKMMEMIRRFSIMFSTL